MKLKKFNAVVAILSVLALFVHMGYNAYAYFALYYNPFLKTITIIPVMVFMCIHAVCGMCSVFLLGDGTRLDVYKIKNKSTVIQRISAALIFPLLIAHIKTIGLLFDAGGNGNWVVYWLIISAQILFFVVVTIHVITSFSRAFVTLGLLCSENKKRIIDRIVFVFSIVFLLVTVVAIIRGNLLMVLSE
ncbi:MAG: hypothetical protein K5639_00600 [Eubacterium sp.]|nr:hypothetical protein [Eubacterium sp.]